MSSPPDPTSPTDSNPTVWTPASPRFPDLPIEIRLTIFRDAFTPRTVQVREHPMRWFWHYSSDEATALQTFRNDMDPSLRSLLAVNHESRAETLRLYTPFTPLLLAMGVTNTTLRSRGWTTSLGEGAGVERFDREIDTLRLNHTGLLRDPALLAGNRFLSLEWSWPMRSGRGPLWFTQKNNRELLIFQFFPDLQRLTLRVGWANWQNSQPSNAWPLHSPYGAQVYWGYWLDGITAWFQRNAPAGWRVPEIVLVSPEEDWAFQREYYRGLWPDDSTVQD